MRVNGSAVGLFCPGSIAELGVWDVALTDAEVADSLPGYKPTTKGNQRQIVEAVEPLALPADAQGLDLHALRLYRSDALRPTDTVESIFARLGLSDAAAAAYLRKDALFSSRLMRGSGRLITVEANAQQGLEKLFIRWAPQADKGSLAWALLALAAPRPAGPVDGGSLSNFRGNDDSDGYRKSRFLLAGLAGLGRVDAGAQGEFAAKLGVDLGRQTNWTRLIDQAAAVNNQGLVALLAGLGMQGKGWDNMTSVHLYHIVSALNRVGLGAEARMIAVEAVARG